MFTKLLSLFYNVFNESTENTHVFSKANISYGTQNLLSLKMMKKFQPERSIHLFASEGKNSVLDMFLLSSSGNR